MRRKKSFYNKTNTCDNIKEDGNKCENKLEARKAFREYDKNKNWTGRWLCGKCYYKEHNKGHKDNLNRKKSFYNRTNTCDNIKEDGKKCENKLESNQAFREYDKNKNWTGRWLCGKCYFKKRNKEHNRKSMANFRCGQLSRFSGVGKGFIGAQIVCKTLGIDDCNILMDNFCFKIDSKHPKYGLIEIKTSSLHKYMHNFKEIFTWNFEHINSHKFDTLILVCMDDNEIWKDVIKVLIIPYDETIYRNSITIFKEPKKNNWYEIYQVDEKSFNDTYHKMDINKCKVLRKDEKIM
jgi:hypothetical protein